MRLQKRRLAVVLLVILSATMTGCLGLFGKTSEVKGKVTLEDGTAIAGATVVLGGVSAQTNAEGEFGFSKVKFGSYSLVVLIDDAKAHEQSVSVQKATEQWEITVLPKTLRLSAPANVYAYLMRPFPSSQSNNIKLEARMKVESNPGASWAPSIFLYWDVTDYAGVGQATNGGLVLAHRSHGLSGTYDKTADGIVAGEWIEVQLELSDRVYVRARPDGAQDWVPVGSVLRNAPLTEAPLYIMVGKGYATEATDAPLLRNSYTGTGPDGSSLFSDVRLLIDDEVVLHEDFVHLGGWEVYYDTNAHERIGFELIPR